MLRAEENREKNRGRTGVSAFRKGFQKAPANPAKDKGTYSYSGKERGTLSSFGRKEKKIFSYRTCFCWHGAILAVRTYLEHPY